MADPFDRAVLTRIHKVSGYRVLPMLAPREALRGAIAAAYDTPGVQQPPEPDPVRTDERIGVSGSHLHANELLTRLFAMKGSDLHLTAGTVPQVRVNGRLVPLDDAPRMLALSRTSSCSIIPAFISSATFLAFSSCSR